MNPTAAPRPSPPIRRRATLCAVVAGLVLAGLANPRAVSAQEGDAEPARTIAPEDTVAYRVAKQELDAIAAREGTPRSSTEILTRNLTRFFVLYPLPDEVDEMQRVLGTAERMTYQVARVLYRGARALAEREGSTSIQLRHVRAISDRLQPRSSERWATYEYFPAATPTPIETWDLEALLDAGIAWGTLGALAENEISFAPTTLPLEEDAARALAEAVNAYALLLLRLGGEHARAELATHVRTDHLREAGKTIAARSSGDPAPIAPAPERPTSGSHFTDVTDDVGIDFRHDTSDWLGRFRRFGPIAPTFSGGGVAARDVDGDRLADLVVCGGHGCVLYVARPGKDGEGGFEDRTDEAGVRIDGEARMPVLADFDNDGDADLFVTYARDTNRLLVNDGKGVFTDVTAGSGLEREGEISGPAVAVDVDNDGLLDLYVGNFGDYLSGASAWVSRDAKNAQANRLYRNRGPGPRGTPRFEEIGERAGVADVGWAQAIGHTDIDRDGDQDLYVANDFGRNQLYRNRGDGTFEAVGGAMGADDPHHGMNVSFTDANGDGYPDLFVTNIWFWAAASREVTETNSLLLSESDADGLRYRRVEEGPLVGEDSGWAWAGLFFDLENDGDDDLLVVNGFTDYLTFVQYREHPERPGDLYAINNGRDPNMLFVNRGGELPDELVRGSGIEMPGINSRSVALLDYDLDGDLDVALTTFHERARLFRNDSGTGHWLRLRLEGDPALRVNRDAVGAVVVATTPDGDSLWRQVSGGEGYLGMSDPELSFGLGEHTTVDLDITWPDGSKQSIAGVGADRRLHVRQGHDAVETPSGSTSP